MNDWKEARKNRLAIAQHNENKITFDDGAKWTEMQTEHLPLKINFVCRLFFALQKKEE